MHYEEHYAHARIILAKVCVLVSLLDDTFDMQATLEEGLMLNKAIQRLAVNLFSSLKKCFLSFLVLLIYHAIPNINILFVILTYRWDESAIQILPDYLKKYYVILMNTFKELEGELKEDHKYRMVYCRKAVKSYLSIY